MPRPKSDLRPYVFKLGAADSAAIDEIARAIDAEEPNRSEAVRQAVRWYCRAVRRRDPGKKSG